MQGSLTACTGEKDLWILVLGIIGVIDLISVIFHPNVGHGSFISTAIDNPVPDRCLTARFKSKWIMKENTPQKAVEPAKPKSGTTLSLH